MAQQQEAVGQEVPEPAAAGPAQITGEARALIGWMSEEMALRFLNGLRGDSEPTDEQRARAAAARAAVAGREPTPTQDDADIVAPAPQELLATLGAERVTALAAEGFEVRMVDLERVRGFQPNVFNVPGRGGLQLALKDPDQGADTGSKAVCEDFHGQL